jgi:hypothetical protein
LTTFFRKRSGSNLSIFRSGFQSLWIVLVAAGLFVLMLALVPESRTYFENYWQKRLGVVISGTREDAALTGWARLSIFVILAKELVGLAVISLVLFFISKKKKMNSEGVTPSHPLTYNTQKISLLFLLVGFAATLPMMLSARQSGMYIIPSLPMFALAAGYFHLPLLHSWLSNPGEKTVRFLEKLKIVSWIGSLILLAHVLYIFGKPGREKALLHDLPYIRQSIPEGEKVAACEKLMADLHAHTYLQRFHHLELSHDAVGCRFALTDRVCDDEAMQAILKKNGFEKIEKEGAEGGVFRVYEKR